MYMSMVKAEIKLSDGTKINIDGTPEEIMRVKNLITLKEPSSSAHKPSNELKKRMQSKVGPLQRIRILIDNNFFKQKRGIEDVRQALEEKAFFYKSSDISPSLIRLVKKGELRRIKEGGTWKYVNA